jgi:hypothetical protein
VVAVASRLQATHGIPIRGVHFARIGVLGELLPDSSKIRPQGHNSACSSKWI